MPLNNEQKKQYKSIGHDLKPVLIVAGNGLNEGVVAELDRALADHELIKVEIRSEDREERAATIAELCKAGRAELVQTIGHQESQRLAQVRGPFPLFAESVYWDGAPIRNATVTTIAL